MWKLNIIMCSLFFFQWDSQSTFYFSNSAWNSTTEFSACEWEM